jgi:hypothetical protein
MKIRSGKPDFWHLGVTLFAMAFIGYTVRPFSYSLTTETVPANLLILAGLYVGLYVFAWAFLIRDLIKQISLIVWWLRKAPQK